MFINKSKAGANNICGKWVAFYRKQMYPKVSQMMLAEMLQIAGLDVDKNTIQRIESGKRFVTDIELSVLAQVLKVEVTQLLRDE